MIQNRFEYKQEWRGGLIIFKLSGSLDIGTVSSMRSNIDSLISKGPHKVLFDLYELNQIDSSGVGALIAIFKRIRLNDGDMKVSRLTGQPKEIFGLLRLDKVFEIYGTFDEAIQSFG